MKKRTSGVSPWALQRPFHFETGASLEKVVQSLSQLADSAEEHKISCQQTEDGYQFNYRLQRLGTRGRYMTASAEGHIGENNLGQVIVEGTAQIAPMSQYGKAGFVVAFLTLAMFLITEDILVLFPLLPLATGTLLILNYYRERDILVEHIANAIHPSAQPEKLTQKDKRLSRAELKRSVRLTDVERRSPDSIWNEAISEYDQPGQEQEV
jgi:hypothetical protein